MYSIPFVEIGLINKTTVVNTLIVDFTSLMNII